MLITQLPPYLLLNTVHFIPLMWKKILLLWKKFDCLEEILVTNKKRNRL
jgi:hypothetical protein